MVEGREVSSSVGAVAVGPAEAARVGAGILEGGGEHGVLQSVGRFISSLRVCDFSTI